MKEYVGKGLMLEARGERSEAKGELRGLRLKCKMASTWKKMTLSALLMTTAVLHRTI